MNVDDTLIIRIGNQKINVIRGGNSCNNIIAVRLQILYSESGKEFQKIALILNSFFSSLYKSLIETIREMVIVNLRLVKQIN